MYSSITLIGHLGQAPQTRMFDSGSSVTRFSLATSSSWKDSQGEKQEKTEWHNIVLWGKLGELAQQYLLKGSKVLIVGRLSYRSAEHDGQTRNYTDIVASEMKFLSTKSTPTNTSSFENTLPKGQPKSLTALRSDDKEDLPF
jgi:single-strand DNA-binding protein